MEFPWDELRVLQAQHHRFLIRWLLDEVVGLSSLFPVDFASYEVSLRLDPFTSALRDESSFLDKITELTICITSQVDLDLRYLPSIECSCEDAWKSLQCHPLDYLNLLGIRHGLMQLQHPISVKHVSLNGLQSEELIIAQLYPDTERLSLFRFVHHLCDVNLDGMSQLRDIQVLGEWNLITTNPIHFSHFKQIFVGECVSANITASSLGCTRLSLALQMLPRLRYVASSSIFDISSEESALMLPRTVVINWDLLLEIDRPATIHMLLNRSIATDCSEAMQRLHEWTFSRLRNKYDENLLLLLLEKSQDIPRFEWSDLDMSQDEQCRLFRYMLQLRQPIDWSRVVHSRTSLAALKLLLSERPEFATRAFGEENFTLLHAVCRWQCPEDSVEENHDYGDDIAYAYAYAYADGDDDEEKHYDGDFDVADAYDFEEEVDDDDDGESMTRMARAFDLSHCLVQHGADPSARDSHGKTPFHYFLELKRKGGRR